MDEYLLIFINKNGEIYTIENTGKDINYDHFILFYRMDFLLGENIFDDLHDLAFDLGGLSGYVLSEHCTKQGYIVIWPTAVSSKENVVASIPPKVTEEQLKTYQELQEKINEHYYVSEKQKSFVCKNILFKLIPKEKTNKSKKRILANNVANK